MGAGKSNRYDAEGLAGALLGVGYSTWHEECYEACGGSAFIQMGLSFTGQYWGLVA